MADQIYFITGLCMQGNKGGPAIALSLTHALRQHMPEATFIFSVPGGPEFEHEQVWAERYGYRVIENLDIRHLVPPFAFSLSRMRRLWRWVKALRSTKAMIQMSAISYVGPPSSNPKLRTLLSGRFKDFCLARICRRPMLAWTQSYGPLSTPLVRFFAATDLKRQPMVFCRGDDCLAAVRELIPGKEAHSYPDIAITLPYDREWAHQYLREHGWPEAGFASISPSAVIYGKSRRLDDGNGHIDYLKDICTDLLKRGIPVLIIPHTFRPGRHHPGSCDYGTSLELMEALQGLDAVHLIEDDLSPVELKSLISLADFHIGGRYHSVVAALSSGVPAISLSWHPKYMDLMRAYGMEEFVIADTASPHAALVDKLLMTREAVAKRVVSKHEEVVRQSAENVAAFVKLLRVLP